MSYDALREFADSWGMVLMGLGFIAFCGWTFLPHVRDANRRAANSIFEDKETIDD